MNKVTQRRLNMCERAHELVGTLTLSPAGGALVTELAGVITLVKQLARDQVSYRGGVSVGAEARAATADELRAVMRILSRVAQQLDPAEFPRVAEQFQMPATESYQTLMATARAFETNMAPIKEEFVRHLSAPFVDLLSELIAQFETGTLRKNAALNGRVTSTKAMDTAALEGVKIVRDLDPIVRAVIRDDAGKMAAWKSASHVMRRLPKAQVEGPTSKVEGLENRVDAVTANAATHPSPAVTGD